MGIDQKYVIIHADDAGLSHSQNRATIECLKVGIVNSYSIMVPCPAFEEIALFAKAHPEYDYGIHLTLTCEWRDYKFGPVLPIEQVSSLIDQNGHFYKTRQEVKKNVKATEVYNELKAQIQKAIDFGLQPTHLDSHMYSVGASLELFEIYKQLGKEYDLPILINEKLLEMVVLSIQESIAENDFTIDYAHFATFEVFKKSHLSTYYKDMLHTIEKGLSIVLIHPAFDDEEMKRITIDHPNFGSEWRQMDYDTFSEIITHDHLKEHNIQLITWKEISEHLMG